MYALSSLAIYSLFLSAGLVSSTEICATSYGDVSNPYPNPDSVAPDVFTVQFQTNVTVNGTIYPPIELTVIREWAPLGVDRFYSLVRDGYYNQAAFFRVVPNFVVQFGIAADPEESSKWDDAIPDDPVVMSNIAWTVSYATSGPNTRTTQIFINYVDNSRLDYGFAPFAVVTSGFETALAITNPTPDSSNGADQDLYYEYGNSWILSTYPNISVITCGTVYVDGGSSSDSSTSHFGWKKRAGIIFGTLLLGALIGAGVLFLLARKGLVSISRHVRESEEQRSLLM
jgi:peptidyl-prolyl cis-trans isomerase A (cyclophilin A)